MTRSKKSNGLPLRKAPEIASPADTTSLFAFVSAPPVPAGTHPNRDDQRRVAIPSVHPLGLVLEDISGFFLTSLLFHKADEAHLAQQSLNERIGFDIHQTAYVTLRSMEYNGTRPKPDPDLQRKTVAPPSVPPILFRPHLAGPANACLDFLVPDIMSTPAYVFMSAPSTDHARAIADHLNRCAGLPPSAWDLWPDLYEKMTGSLASPQTH